jgi:predicted secreted protein
MIIRNLLITAALTASFATKAEEAKTPTATFDVSVSQSPANDELQVVLTSRVQGSNAQQVTQQVTAAVNKVMAGAKVKPVVSAELVSLGASPTFNRESRITGWTGAASVRLRSTDIGTLADLAPTLSKEMPISSAQFVLSASARKTVEAGMTKELGQEIERKAIELTSALGFASYAISEVRLNTQHVGYGAPMASMAVMRSAEVEPLPTDAGTATVQVQANVVIRLLSK